MSDWLLILSCEHGGNRVPSRWSGLFAGAGARALLSSHRGWDPGALELARRIAPRLRAPLIACTTTRLLADANRPLGHPRLFSRFTRALPRREKLEVLRSVHEPHWRRVEASARAALSRHRRVLHLSIHSFTPVLAGVARNCELGLLFDSRRRLERGLCERWQAGLEDSEPELRVRRNYPYRGSSAALTTSLRRRFPADAYLGVELELNQGWWRRLGPAEREQLAAVLARALRRSLRPRRVQRRSRRTRAE